MQGERMGGRGHDVVDELEDEEARVEEHGAALAGPALRGDVLVADLAARVRLGEALRVARVEHVGALRAQVGRAEVRLEHELLQHRWVPRRRLRAHPGKRAEAGEQLARLRLAAPRVPDANDAQREVDSEA